MLHFLNTNAQATRKANFMNWPVLFKPVIMAFTLLSASISWGQVPLDSCGNSICNFVVNGNFECSLDPCDPEFPDESRLNSCINRGNCFAGQGYYHFSPPLAAVINQCLYCTDINNNLVNVVNNWFSTNSSTPDLAQMPTAACADGSFPLAYGIINQFTGSYNILPRAVNGNNKYIRLRGYNSIAGQQQGTTEGISTQINQPLRGGADL